MVEVKVKRSFRVSVEADTLMDTLADKFGLSKTDILEMSIRYFAQYQGEGVEKAQPLPPPKNSSPE